jgi:hypothetical protein
MDVFFAKLQRTVMPRQPNSGPFLSDTPSNDLIYVSGVFCKSQRTNRWFFEKNFKNGGFLEL